MQVTSGALVENGDHVGARQACGGPSFADEPGDEILVTRQFRMGDLQRDGTVEPDVTAEVHSRHSAAGQLRIDQIPAVQQLPDRG